MLEFFLFKFFPIRTTREGPEVDLASTTARGAQTGEVEGITGENVRLALLSQYFN
ncbi:hypothetical protein J2Y03_003822 [Neobacillus niacini]|nr:hypothetical protein [Neobacillus niacini]